jgi:hypothetical protein
MRHRFFKNPGIGMPMVAMAVEGNFRDGKWLLHHTGFFM